MADTEKAVRVRVTGRVQGVFFRAWTRDEALRRGLGGWVRNEADGSVSAMIAGPAPAVEAMIAALWRGPPRAEVADVAVETVPPGDRPAGFRIDQ